MKDHSLSAGRLAPNRVAVAAACAVLSLLPISSWALGLGRLNVQSALGEGLRAEIDISSISSEEAATLQVKVASPETYRAAGVDYNQVLSGTNIVLSRRADGRPYLRVASERVVQEPFIDVILDLQWSSGRLVREYTLLFDPPTVARAPARAAQPVMDAAPVAAAPAPLAAPVRTPAAPAPTPTPASSPSTAAAPAPAPAPERAAAPAPAPTATASGEDSEQAETTQVRVKSGDTLSSIAQRQLPQGVSLDQMLVGLYRSNPHAFQGKNMNRLKAGVVLNMPSAEQLEDVSRSQARQVIVAQSADFSAYRQRLAGLVSTTPAEQPERQATGKVEAEVKDQKQAAAPAPDKLTLSKGSVATSKAPAAEDRLASARAQQDDKTRAAELSKNLDDLRRLKEAAAASAAKAAAPAPVPVAPMAASAPVVAEAAAAASAALAASAAQEEAAAAQASASAASEAATAVADAASEAASQVAEAPVVAAPEVERPAAVPAPVSGPAWYESLDPRLLGGGAAVLALLGGLFWFIRSRRRSDSGETSFLESRLQPDSFFGASGGQRVDTRDATGAPSSMSYSLSQLDAIGDVDPVAEADVYLAYGRDLQAEEILKEALRSTPDRMAIRIKLAEVYAKRRDTKGFEQLAGQLHESTDGAGEDWARVQELGLSIDPENPLYLPGGKPVEREVDDGYAHVEGLGASTIPHSVVPSAQFAEAPSADVDVDLDVGTLASPAPAVADFAELPSLDLSDEAAPEPASARSQSEPEEFRLDEVAQPASARSNSLDFDLPLDGPEFASNTVQPEPAPSFDLGEISLDMEEPSDSTGSAHAAPVNDDFLGQAPELPEPSDPLERKFELAEEFRQIGDMDGARELLQEVIENASGGLRHKAQSMLDTLN